jgi:hypothetical protein
MTARTGRRAEFTVVEWGAGRGEMAEAFADFSYTAVDVGRGAPPGVHRRGVRERTLRRAAGGCAAAERGRVAGDARGTEGAIHSDGWRVRRLKDFAEQGGGRAVA